MHPSQKIHSSLLLAEESNTNKYIPKARPYGKDEATFWTNLQNPAKDSKFAAKWLEVDLYKSTQAIVEGFTGPDCAALQCMHDIATSGKISQSIRFF
jgi:hypothetical protein